MGNRIDLNKQELYDYYIGKNKSKKETAKYFGVHEDTITRNLIQYGIPRHKPRNWLVSEEYKLSENQINIINGALLGDGNIALTQHAANACFSYTSKSLEHVKFVCSDLFEFSTEAQKLKKVSIFDKRTQKTYTRTTFRTTNNIAFTKLYNNWYHNNKKHIPKDIILNQTTCLIWYLGDGTLTKTNRSFYILLCTDCFEKTELEEILIPQLIQFEPQLLEHSKNKWRIMIPRRKVKDFLEYIGHCPVEDYKHKWEYKEYKNTYIKYNPEIEKGILYNFDNGISPGTIAKYYNIDRTTVINCLTRNNKDITKNKFKKQKVVINNDERQLRRSYERI